MSSNLCEAPFVYNSNTDKCESYTISPPNHCVPNNNNIFEYNANTKMCVFNSRIEKEETVNPTNPLGIGGLGGTGGTGGTGGLGGLGIIGSVIGLKCPEEYTLVNNLCTKKIVNEITIVNDPVCKPETIEMPDKQCKSVSNTKEPNRPPPPLPPPQSAAQILAELTAKPAVQPVQQTDNTSLIIIIFIILFIGIGAYYLINKNNSMNRYAPMPTNIYATMPTNRFY
jgi:hypothetical protein